MHKNFNRLTLCVLLIGSASNVIGGAENIFSRDDAPISNAITNTTMSFLQRAQALLNTNQSNELYALNLAVEEGDLSGIASLICIDRASEFSSETISPTRQKPFAQVAAELESESLAMHGLSARYLDFKLARFWLDGGYAEEV